jgi:DNA-binding response OmpR family regulator
MVDKKHTFLGKKILIISDDSAFLNSIELMLLYAGVDTIICDSLSKGIASIKTQNPDLILLDQAISKITIDKLIAEINIENQSDLPIILLTDHEYDLENNINIGYILKKTSLDFADLIKSIENSFFTEKKQDKNLIDITEKSVLPVVGEKNKEIRVLVIEDDPLLRNLLSVRLTKGGIPYYFCHNGNDALVSAYQYKPTVIILDIMLPGKNGIDVLNEMRQIPEFSKTPVIIFSNKDNDSDRKKAKMLGVETFLIKAMTDLNDLIKLIIEKHHS